MIIGWFSASIFHGPIICRRYLATLRNHCIYTKPNGGYAVITQVRTHTSKSPDNCKLLGEVTECLIHTASPFSKMAELDQDKLASAAREVGLSVEEVIGWKSRLWRPPPIDFC